MTSGYLRCLLPFQNILYYPRSLWSFNAKYSLILILLLLSSAFLAWFCHFEFYFHEMVSTFLCSVIYLAVSIFLSEFTRWYVNICTSGAPLSTTSFLNISKVDGVFFPPPHIGGICPSPYPVPTFSHQIPSRNKAMPILSFLLAHVFTFNLIPKIIYL